MAKDTQKSSKEESSSSSQNRLPKAASEDLKQLESRLAQRQHFTIVLLVVIISILWYQLAGGGVAKLAKTDSQTQESSSSVPNIGDVKRPIAWVTGQNMHHGYLAHIIKVFQQIGYVVAAGPKPPPRWDVLWAHEYPFVQSFALGPIEPHQKVNHFPGSGFITNKVNLATSGLKYVPKAFNLPREKDTFLKFAKENPDKLWVQKDNNHRGIRVRSIAELDLEQTGTFVQEYIQNPLLIDGKKFDIGLYVTLTSVNPLRVYVYDNDALLRFCAKEYLPFNGTDLDSYVVGDKYTPTWEMPSLAPYFVTLNMNMKQTLNSYIKQKLDKDPATIWTQMEESIKTIYYMKEEQLTRMTEMYPDKKNFFEMVRFDFTLDEDLNVYLMEANMSPNMASAKYPPNKQIYEPVLYSLFHLTGLTRIPATPNWNTIPQDSEWDMFLLERDLSILPDICSEPKCHARNETSSGCETEDHCDVCFHCLEDKFKLTLKDAYLEEYSRWHNKRLIPSTSVESPVSPSVANYLQEKWYIGKCLQDPKWCN